MYERSAIVLERYFDNLLGFNKKSNLRQNFKNYCELFEKFKNFQTANSEEFNALAEFQDAENTIEEIQNSHEKLYKKNAKLEYNRDLIFNDISVAPAEIEKCIIKIENDMAKNQANYISLREKFVEAVRNYNEKKSNLAKCKKNRKNAESEYNSIFEDTNKNLDSIPIEFLDVAKKFVNDENKEELISSMSSNGKDEKIPFNNQVITNASKFGFDIFAVEEECYVEAHKMAQKLIKELLEGAVSIELHEKVLRNLNAKLQFVESEKEYLVQFLDFERVTSMYGKRSHRTLMIEACEKFNEDIAQINNLYTLLLKEIANKSTKKGYKELYNKSYLIDIEEKDAKFKKEKNKVPVGTIMNENYWRIEGIKNIYTVFYKTVSNVFGKDLDEFEVPKEDLEEVETIEQIETEKVEKVKVDEEKLEVEESKVEEIKPEVKESKVEEIKVIEPAIVEEPVETSKVKKVRRYSRKIIAVKELEPIPEIKIEEAKVKEIKSEVEEVKVEKKAKKTTKKSKKENVQVAEKVEEVKLAENIEPAVVEENVEISKAEEISEIETNEEKNEEFDIFGEKYKDIDAMLSEIDELDKFDEETQEFENLEEKHDIFETSTGEDILDMDFKNINLSKEKALEPELEEIEDLDTSIFDKINELDELEEILPSDMSKVLDKHVKGKKENQKKKGIFGKLIKLNNTTKDNKVAE